ncbi:MAG: hypothetical protein HZB57_00790 [Gammaproteobacteria bacterium]|nr:hypothetical protein [Gammaproteobacteria bacterium]
MTDDVKHALTELQTARVFFGHQSVGGNIMAGVQDILTASNTTLPILELGKADALPAGFILHTPVGKNTEPKTKCDDFKRIVDQQLAGKIDYALLKFCYIDIDEKSDVDTLFAYYRATLDDLKARHPEITFIHVTAPLRHSPTGLGVWVRELLGKPNRSKLANVKRQTFNERLLSTYAGDPIFDLAASESTYPDGRREAFTHNGKTYYSLIGAYTNDGGHLNALSRKKVAADFIRSLAYTIRGNAP